eukprot:1070876-Rhodomonas_salina.1
MPEAAAARETETQRDTERERDRERDRERERRDPRPRRATSVLRPRRGGEERHTRLAASSQTWLRRGSDVAQTWLR